MTVVARCTVPLPNSVAVLFRRTRGSLLQEAMKLLPIKIACPVCSSENITYTCEPKCCFNHICDSCYSTFELATGVIGGDLEVEDFQPEERDPLTPTAACARCESIDVYALEGGDTLICVSCHARLNLVLDSIKPR